MEAVITLWWHHILIWWYKTVCIVHWLTCCSGVLLIGSGSCTVCLCADIDRPVEATLLCWVGGAAGGDEVQCSDGGDAGRPQSSWPHGCWCWQHNESHDTWTYTRWDTSSLCLTLIRVRFFYFSLHARLLNHKMFVELCWCLMIGMYSHLFDLCGCYRFNNFTN